MIITLMPMRGIITATGMLIRMLIPMRRPRSEWASPSARF